MADNQQPRHMIACERRLARMRIQGDGEAVEEVAHRLRRNRSSIWNLLADELDERVGVGRCMKYHVQAGRRPLARYGRDYPTKAHSEHGQRSHASRRLARVCVWRLVAQTT